MFKGRSVAVVVTAAGSGKRMGAPVPKQFLKLNNETILEQAVGKFRHVDAVDRIVIVVPADYTEKCRALFSVGSESEDGRGRRSTDVISGGAERQDSVCAALDALAGSGFSGEDIVLIHDGVRPFVDTEIIENVIRQTAESGAAIAAVPVRDTVRDRTGGTLDRSRLYNVQTPQGFRFSVIREAFDKAYRDGFYGTDEAGLAERIGVMPEIVNGSPANIKITTPEDLRQKMRIGTGFDVHRLVRDRKLVLGGVEIPFDKGLLGHSDADVLIHALMDAMLGAAALGDIGVFFPDSNPQYEGASSLQLLEEVAAAVRDAGYRLGNADVTVICQEPKLAEFIPVMCRKVAAAAGVSESQISIKATTTEKLGFTGRGEGIAAEAVCILE